MIIKGQINALDPKEFEQDLIYFVAFDEDLNGNNGDDYTDEDALKLGLTTGEYWAKLAREKADSLISKDIDTIDAFMIAIEEFLDKLKGTWGAVNNDPIEFNIESCGDTIEVVFVVANGN